MDNDDFKDESPINEDKKTGSFAFESAPKSNLEKPIESDDWVYSKNKPFNFDPSGTVYQYQYSALPGVVQGLVISVLSPLIIFGLIELLFFFAMTSLTGGLSNLGWAGLFVLLPFHYGWTQLFITVPQAPYVN